MRRAFLTVVAAGLVAMVIVLASQDGDRAFSLNVVQDATVGPLAPHATLCQRSVPVPATGAFREVALAVPDRLVVRVRRAGRVIAHGAVTGGRARLDATVPGDAVVDVCLTNPGPRALALPGGALGAVASTRAEIGGRAQPADVALTFACGCGRSALGDLRNQVRNAEFFKFAAGNGVFAVLFALALLLGVPGLLWLALGDRTRREGW